MSGRWGVERYRYRAGERGWASVVAVRLGWLRFTASWWR